MCHCTASKWTLYIWKILQVVITVRCTIRYERNFLQFGKEKRSWYVSLWKWHVPESVYYTEQKLKQILLTYMQCYQVSQYADLFSQKYSCNLNNLLITVHTNWSCVWGNYSPKIYRRVKTFGLLTPYLS